MHEPTTDGLPADLAAVVSDQSVVISKDAVVFEAIAAWAHAPSATASAELTAPYEPAVFDGIYGSFEATSSTTPAGFC